jgi:hypothetical protein
LDITAAFSAVLDNVARMSKRFNDSGEFVDIEFVLDERVIAEDSVREIFATYKHQPEWLGDTTLRRVSFTTSSDARIQVADLLAREARKDMERSLGHEKRAQRLAFRALDESGKFIFVRRGRDFCEALKSAMPALASQTGFDEKSYRAWLGRHRLSDNIQSRVLFLRHLDDTRNSR